LLNLKVYKEFVSSSFFIKIHSNNNIVIWQICVTRRHCNRTECFTSICCASLLILLPTYPFRCPCDSGHPFVFRVQFCVLPCFILVILCPYVLRLTFCMS
jgi:hypothetical protein